MYASEGGVDVAIFICAQAVAWWARCVCGGGGGDSVMWIRSVNVNALTLDTICNSALHFPLSTIRCNGRILRLRFITINNSIG